MLTFLLPLDIKPDKNIILSSAYTKGKPNFAFYLTDSFS